MTAVSTHSDFGIALHKISILLSHGCVRVGGEDGFTVMLKSRSQICIRI